VNELNVYMDDNATQKSCIRMSLDPVPSFMHVPPLLLQLGCSDQVNSVNTIITHDAPYWRSGISML